MTTLRQAAEQALKALELLNNGEGSTSYLALVALRTALAADTGEPVAWMSQGGVLTRDIAVASSWRLHGGVATPLFTHPSDAEQLRKDAARYRHLRDKGLMRSGVSYSFDDEHELQATFFCEFWLREQPNFPAEDGADLTAEQFDLAIDAAMKEQK